ncbi:MAG: hypothetical protein WBM50_01975 [Acidimicrobiales bacterium]
MSATLLIFVFGCTLFALTTLASLWVGYLTMQRAWVAQNPELTTKNDDIRPLFSKTYPEQEEGEVVVKG